MSKRNRALPESNPSLARSVHTFCTGHWSYPFSVVHHFRWVLRLKLGLTAYTDRLYTEQGHKIGYFSLEKVVLPVFPLCSWWIKQIKSGEVYANTGTVLDGFPVFCTVCWWKTTPCLVPFVKQHCKGTFVFLGTQRLQWWCVVPEDPLSCILVTFDTSTAWGAASGTAALQERLLWISSGTWIGNVELLRNRKG